MGGEAERRLHFQHGPPPPQGKGDAVSRVWALSPPGTTDWAAFGRQVSGAWSVARSPPPSPGARHFCRKCPCAEPSSTSLRPRCPFRGGRCGVSSKPPRGVPIPPRPKQGRRDSGVSAAVWGVGGVVPPQNPHGESLSPRGPSRAGGTRVYPPLCGGWVVWCLL